jgi:hypothetical protein
VLEEVLTMILQYVCVSVGLLGINAVCVDL